MKPAWRVAFWVLLAIVIAQGVSLYLGRRALWEQRVATANAKAAGDRTRVRLAGQLRIASRFMYQGQVELGAALRAKGQTDHALVRLTIERDSLRRETPAALVFDTAAQTLNLQAVLDARDTLGVTVGVHAAIDGTRPASALRHPTGVVTWRVEREPIPLEVALSCNGADALAQVSGPQWAAIDLRDVRQDPMICNPPPRAWEPFSFQVPSLPWAAGLVGLGIVLKSLIP